MANTIPIADMRVRSDTNAYIGPAANFPAGYLKIQNAALGTKGADLASASTVSLANATGDFVDITGTTTITSLGTASAGREQVVRFTGVLTLTHNATSLILPTGANIATANGDCAVFRCLGSSNWKCIAYFRGTPRVDANVMVDSSGLEVIRREIDGATVIANSAETEVINISQTDIFLQSPVRLGSTLALLDGALLATQGSNIASGATTNIAGATGDFVNVTGTTTITALGTAIAGTVRTLVFTGVLTLTHNATSLILPTASNIVTVAGDSAVFRSLGSGNWKCVAYLRADGRPLVQFKAADVAAANTTDIGSISGDFVKITTGTGTILAFGTAPSGVERTLIFGGIITIAHDATALILPTGRNITTAVNDIARFRSLGAGNWQCVGYLRADGSAINITRGADIASASNLNLANATGDYFDVTGTTTITALGSNVPIGRVFTIRFAGILTLTYDATALILPTAANIVTAAGDVAVFRSLGSGNWKCVSYLRADGSAVNITKSADIASASNLNLGTNATGDFVDVTGTTTITSLGSNVPAGRVFTLRFTGASTLTHNSTSLILPTGANIPCANGDTAIFRSLGGGNWKCVDYTRASGAPLSNFFNQSVNIGDDITVGEVDANGIVVSPNFILTGSFAQTALATSGTISINASGALSTVYTITPSGACTFNANSGGVAGARCTFIITTSGTSSYTLTFGTNFKTTGTLATGTVTAKVFTIDFICRSDNTWLEVGRTAAM